MTKMVAITMSVLFAVCLRVGHTIFLHSPFRSWNHLPILEKKPGFFARTGHTISKWFRDFKSECKKIVWPTRKQVINNTIVVCVVVLISALVVLLLDVVFGLGMDLLLTAGA